MKHLTIIFLFLPIYLLGQSDLDTKMDSTDLYTILDGQTGEIKWGGYLPLKGEAPLGKVADGRILVPSMNGWMLFRPNMEE